MQKFVNDFSHKRTKKQTNEAINTSIFKAVQLQQKEKKLWTSVKI